MGKTGGTGALAGVGLAGGTEAPGPECPRETVFRPAVGYPLVGLIVPDIQNEFYSTVAKVMAEGCAIERLQLVLAVSDDDPEIEADHVAALIHAGARGIVITPSATPRRSMLSALRRVPVVQLARDHDDIRGDVVGADDQSGMRAVVRHLVGLGHRRIAFVGTPESSSTGAARLHGFRSALDDAGLALAEELLALGPPRPGFGREAVARLLSLDVLPTALVLAGFRFTLGALDAVRRADLAVPGRLSLVGYGDPEWFRLWGPGITTVGLPVREIAATTASLLFRRIRDRAEEGEDDHVPTRAPFAPHLIVRGTTAPCPRQT